MLGVLGASVGQLSPEVAEVANYAIDNLMNVLVAIALVMSVMPSALWRPPKSTTVPAAYSARSRGMPARTQLPRTRPTSKHLTQAPQVGCLELHTQKAYVASNLIHQALSRCME